jgi:hypothetical protein
VKEPDFFAGQSLASSMVFAAYLLFLLVATLATGILYLILMPAMWVHDAFGCKAASWLNHWHAPHCKWFKP